MDMNAQQRQAIRIMHEQFERSIQDTRVYFETGQLSQREKETQRQAICCFVDKCIFACVLSLPKQIKYAPEDAREARQAIQILRHYQMGDYCLSVDEQIFLLKTEGLRPECLKFMGEEAIPTPNLYFYEYDRSDF